ncbi:MAG TPA: RagB/SusD family nutrient uptake outer membrane protein [Bacteroidales bacterium]
MKRIILYTAIIGLLTNSCSKDFLDRRPEATLPITGIDYSKLENMFMPVSNAYAQLRSDNVHAFPYMGIFEITSDDADKGSTPDDSPPMIEFNSFAYGSTNSLINDYWTGVYNVISASNFAILALPNFVPYIKQQSDMTSYLQDLGDARFIRAYAYFNLGRVFGGVPIIDSTNSASELATKTRVSLDSVYSFVHRDLLYAIQYLPASWSKEWAGRVTKYSAMALNAKVFLYQNKMDSVKYYTDQIIASNLYDLYPNFYKEFRSEGANSQESLFEIQSSTLGRTTGDQTYCDYAYEQGPRGNSPQNLQGWGFKVPSPGLIAFLQGRNETIRIHATIMARGTKTDEGDSIKAICVNPYYNMKTYMPSYENKWSYNGYGFDYNIRILRFAEVLLMNAEANVALGNSGAAATSLNRVRARVGLAPIASPNIQDVYDERRAELALEENRFFDLVRTGRAAAILGPLGFKTGKNEVFPIPYSQIQLNPNLIQNSGY